MTLKPVVAPEATRCQACGEDVGEDDLWPLMFQKPGEHGFCATGLELLCSACWLSRGLADLDSGGIYHLMLEEAGRLATAGRV